MKPLSATVLARAPEELLCDYQSKLNACGQNESAEVAAQSNHAAVTSDLQRSTLHYESEGSQAAWDDRCKLASNLERAALDLNRARRLASEAQEAEGAAARALVESVRNAYEAELT